MSAAEVTERACATRSAPDLIRAWACHGARLTALRRSYPDWASARRLIDASIPALIANGARVRELLIESNRKLHPLCDPLLTDYGVHDWLRNEREEAYSDWLSWTMRQFDTAQRLLDLLDINDAEASALTGPFVPEREVFVPLGHPGHTGKLDIRVRVPGALLIQIEVKVCAPEDADLEKQRGYARCPLAGVPRRHVHRRLVALRGEVDNYDGGFQLVPWNRIAVKLRRFAAELVGAHAHKPDAVSRAATVLAFAGAIEQNLLGYSARVARLALNRESVPLSAEMVSHLEESLGESTWDS